jgi:hypothetical protein
MASVNQPNPKIDLTVKIFDNFYNFALDVPVEEYDVVNTFFKSVFKDKEAADSFTVSLFRVASETQTDVLTLLSQLEDQDQIAVTETLCYYLNGIRSPSTLLGINATVTPNYWTARNVFQ